MVYYIERRNLDQSANPKKVVPVSMMHTTPQHPIGRRALFIIFLIAFSLWVASPAWGRKKKVVVPTLPEQIEAIVKASPIANGFLGVEVYSLDRNEVVYERDAHHLFIPASNTKLFTTATALARLSGDFRFHTTLESSGRIDKYGRLTGDLIFVGRGDPNLSNRVLPYDPKAQRSAPPLGALNSLADQLVAKGIQVIDGDIVGDDSYYVNEPFGDSWSWDDLMWGYGAPVSALTINDNVFSVTIQPGETVGDKAFVTLDPFYSTIRVRNELLTTAANIDQNIHLERVPGSAVLRLWGTFPIDGVPDHEVLAVEHPARVAAESLREILRSKGIQVYGSVRTHHRELWELGPTLGAVPSDTPKRAVLAEIVSHPLIEDLKVIDKVSQNLHAEMLLRLLGAQLMQEGSVRAGLAVEKEFLTQAGLDEKEFHFNDGSGLDPHNVVAPHAVVGLLKYIWSQPYRDTFLDLLPVSGADGTLGSRFQEAAFVGKISAKTGTLTHANALSGFATSPSGEHFAFSMFTNNHIGDSKVATATMDKILETILAYREPPGKKSKKR